MTTLILLQRKTREVNRKAQVLMLDSFYSILDYGLKVRQHLKARLILIGFAALKALHEVWSHC